MKKLLLALLTVVPFMLQAQVSNPESVLTKLSQSGYTASVDNIDSTQMDATNADKLIDGNTSTYWETDWHTGSPLPHWCVIDMGSAQNIDGIYIGFRSGHFANGPDTVSIYTSMDGITWTLQFDSSAIDPQLEVAVEFASTVNAKFYKIFIHTAAGNGVVNITETGALKISIPDPNAYERGEWSIVSFSSEDGPTNVAAAAIDKNRSTFWQSKWQVPVALYPHILVLDRGAAQAGTPINQITYVQRNQFNSQIDTGTVEFSNDGSTWGTPIPLKFTYHGTDLSKNAITLPSVQTGRYIRFLMLRNKIATDDPGGDPTTGGFNATAIAEFGASFDQFLSDPTVYNRSGWSVTTPQASPNGQGPENLIDGNMGTIWQSQWSGTPAPYPHILTFDMGVVQPVNLILYNTWKDANFNSAADSGTIAYSTDGISWSAEIPMKFSHSNGLKDSFLIPTGTQTMRYFRFTIHKNHFVAVNGPGTTATHLATSLTEVWAVYNSALPITFDGGITAQVHGNTIRLNWATATEQNSDYFTITRSTDGVNFTPIGRVAATGVAHQYSFVDNNPSPGVNYYQLVQVDLDGRFTKSATVSARLNSIAKTTLRIAKVTASAVNLFITSPSEVNGMIKVFNMSGRKIASQPIELNKGNNDVQLNINGPSGVYIIVVNSASERLSKQFYKP